MAVLIRPDGPNIVIRNGGRGVAGPEGPGVPAGGTTGQLAAKASNTDYDVEWVDPGAGSGDVVGPASVTDSRIALFDGTTGKLLKQASQVISDLLARANHTGTQIASTISDFTAAVQALFGTTSGTVCQGNDSRLSDARTPTAHTHPLGDLTQSGATSGQRPEWNGSAWVPTTPSAGSPGGSTTQIQFNDGGAFGGDADLTWNKTTNVLTNSGNYVAAKFLAVSPSQGGIDFLSGYTRILGYDGKIGVSVDASTGVPVGIQGWGFGANYFTTDALLVRIAAAIIGVRGATSSAGAALNFKELSADPADPAEGQSTIWQSDGTGAGDDGDIMIKITAGGVTKTGTLIDFSAI